MSPYYRSVRRSLRNHLTAAALAIALLVASVGLRSNPVSVALDEEARGWVDDTISGMSLDEKIGQLIVPSFFSEFVSSDSGTYDDLVKLVHEYHVGGMLVFGTRQAQPDVLLNQAYTRNTRGQPLNAASLINRLQSISAVPLLVAADFETGIGFRLNGGTTFPRAMAFGATDDPQLAYEAGRITASEARAIGIHLNLAPVVDVNNNPMNPVINTRSFGEGPARVAELANAYVSGLRDGGMLATLKHFPGHGDTDVDSHYGLPLITHPRERLDQIELRPFREGISSGVDAVMTAHIVLPSLEPAASTPATFSSRIVRQLLREELGFDGLILTDSLRMRAVTELATPSDAGLRAVQAGHDLLLHSPDEAAAFESIREAVLAGTIDESQLDESVNRILSAKARLELHRSRAVSLDTLPLIVGTRQSFAVAEKISQESLTLIKDDEQDVPLRTPRSGDLLYLSVVDRPSGWGGTTPSAAFIPALRQRWPNVTAAELSNRTPVSEIELISETAAHFDAVIVGIFARASSRNGHVYLSDQLTAMLKSIAKEATEVGQPFVTVMFGNPYAVLTIQELPSILLTYDVADLAQESVVRAISGERSIRGRLPVALSAEFQLGHGLIREAP